MSTDRELLELAAKAAGITLQFDAAGTAWKKWPSFSWNPLTDDGDALRLAVKLYLWEPIMLAHREVSDGVDFYAATRRAITRAAAEIGKAMP